MNPRVTDKLDTIVMKALERDPTYRWKTAAEMREAMREVIAQPGYYTDNEHVTEWVRWVYTQKPGTAASGISHLHSIVSTKHAPELILEPEPEPEPALPPHPPGLEDHTIPSGRPLMDDVPNLTSQRYPVFWLVVAFLVAALLVWRIAG
jgi:hypothetical protein